MSEIISLAFAACWAVSKDREDLHICVRQAAREAGIEWHCTIFPNGEGKACTDAVWQFEKLYAQALFDVAKRVRGQN